MVLLITITISGLVVVAIEATTAAAFHTQALVSSLRRTQVSTATRQVISEDAINQLDTGTLFSTASSSVATRDARLSASFAWVGGLSVKNITHTAPSAVPFIKGAVLTANPGTTFTHPLDVFSGTTYEVGGSLTVSESYAGDLVLGPRLVIRETPCCDIGFVAATTYAPSNGSIPISINGTAYLPFGAAQSAGGAKLAATRLVSSASVAGTRVTGTQINTNAIYRGSWGSPAARFAAASNQPGLLAAQSYFDQANWVVTVQGGAAFHVPAAGVTYRAFPDGGPPDVNGIHPGPVGPKRLVIDLAALSLGATKLYVNCVSAADATNGIVVIGDNGGPAGPIRTVATNGAVWLWKNNTQPVALASQSGAWTLTDSTWSESGVGGAQLSLTWAGHLFSPAATTIVTPQSTTPQFTLQGSLTAAGDCTGNLSLLAIQQVSGSPLRQLVERVAYIYRIY